MTVAEIHARHAAREKQLLDLENQVIAAKNGLRDAKSAAEAADWGTLLRVHGHPFPAEWAEKDDRIEAARAGYDEQDALMRAAQSAT